MHANWRLSQRLPERGRGRLQPLGLGDQLALHPISLRDLRSFKMELPGAWSMARTGSCTAAMTANPPVASLSLLASLATSLTSGSNALETSWPLCPPC
eukprot:6723427-Heterocapsa_arctica.AAC.1